MKNGICCWNGSPGWAQYASLISTAMYTQACQEGRAFHADWREKRVKVVIKYDDGGTICDGIKISEQLALIRVENEKNLLICLLLATPDPELFLIGPSTVPLPEESDHFFFSMAKDMHEMTFVQFATQYEPVMRQMLFNALTEK